MKLDKFIKGCIKTMVRYFREFITFFFVLHQSTGVLIKVSGMFKMTGAVILLCISIGASLAQTEVKNGQGAAVCPCPRNLSPVCGSNGRTYSNECLLNCQAKQDPSLEKSSDGACAPAPRVYQISTVDDDSSDSDSSSSESGPGSMCPCPRIINPVCGTDGTTYDNPCMLRCQQQVDRRLRLAYRGICKRKVVKVTCSCPKKLAPVCGSDGITYSNQCLLRCKQNINKKLVRRSDGSCPAVDPTEQPPSSQTQSVSCACPMNYEPVCGSDNQTYSNQCSLNCKQSTSPGLTKSSDGACPGTEPPQTKTEPSKKIDPCICPMNYAPVCGSDGKTYGNKCTLKCQQSTTPGLTLSSEGSCPESTTAKVSCSATCPKDVAPVCATNNITYSNSCLLDCQTKKDSSVTKKHNGSCQFDSNGKEVGGDLARSGRQWRPTTQN